MKNFINGHLHVRLPDGTYAEMGALDAPQIDDVHALPNAPWSGEKTKQEIDALAEAIATDDPILVYWTNYFNARRTGKVYQTWVPKFAKNQTSACLKKLDNEGLSCTPSTDTTQGTDDYLNGNHPMFEWINVNYKRNADGTPYPTAAEGSPAYKTYGAVDVGAMQMSFYWNYDTTSNEDYDILTISDMPNEAYGLKPWPECVQADGTVLPWCIGSKYFSGKASDGLLRSQPDLPLEVWTVSHNSMITEYQKKGAGYWGAGAMRNTFQQVFTLIKYATKNSQSVFTGCTSYDVNANSVEEHSEPSNYVIMTTANANKFVVGSTVMIGYNTQGRGAPGANHLCDRVRISAITAVDGTNSKVEFDIPESKYFATTQREISGTSYPVNVVTMQWYSGTTDKVLGKNDGSYLNNTNSKMPYRIQGREYGIGAYIIAADTVMDIIGTADGAEAEYTRRVYVAPRGVAHKTAIADIKANYIMLGDIPSNNGASYYIGDLAFDVTTGCWYPRSTGSSASTGWADQFYTNTNTSGQREYLQCGSLNYGTLAGAAFLYGSNNALSSTYWNIAAAD